MLLLCEPLMHAHVLLQHVAFYCNTLGLKYSFMSLVLFMIWTVYWSRVANVADTAPAFNSMTVTALREEVNTHKVVFLLAIRKMTFKIGQINLKCLYRSRGSDDDAQSRPALLLRPKCNSHSPYFPYTPQLLWGLFVATELSLTAAPDTPGLFDWFDFLNPFVICYLFFCTQPIPFYCQ